MATQNRGQKITKLLGQVKKHFKPVPPPQQRTLLEHLLFACLLENSPVEDAERAFAALEANYCGWNEVRVSTRRELSEVLRGLVDPTESAERLKRTLHNIFETVYEFDLEPLKKQTLGQSVKQLEGYVGTTPFMVAYVVQHALGGHSIPINKGLFVALETLDVVTPAEASKGQVPGLERTVPKNKGHEVASMLHQLGVEVGRNPYGPAAKKLLLTLDPQCKDRLPKKVEPAPAPAPAPPPAPPAKEAAKAPAAAPSKKPAAKAEPAPASAPPPAPAGEKKPAAKAKPAPAEPAKKKPAPAAPEKKKPAAKPAPAAKKPAAVPKKKVKTASKQLTKKKPK